MGKWIKGDVHIHSHCCMDGHVPVMDIVEQSRKFCDFLAISGHAEQGDRWGEKQYSEILEARKQYPEIPIFHTAEQEFPIERHTMFLTTPDNREFDLQAELVRRGSGHPGDGRGQTELASDHSRQGTFPAPGDRFVDDHI